MNIINMVNCELLHSKRKSLIICPTDLKNDTLTNIVILNEAEIHYDKTINKLIGRTISLLIIPQKYQEDFFETAIGEIIKPQLVEKYTISYY